MISLPAAAVTTRLGAPGAGISPPRATNGLASGSPLHGGHRLPTQYYAGRVSPPCAGAPRYPVPPPPPLPYRGQVDRVTAGTHLVTLLTWRYCPECMPISATP